MSDHPSEFDVAIVGFGPSGAVAAAQLGQAGLHVLVVDKAHDVYDKPRAISMDHEILRVLQGIGIAERIAPFVEPFSPSEHYGVDGQLIRRLDMLVPPYPMGWTPSMVFLQPPVEAALREKVAALDTVEIRLGVKLTELVQDDAGVRLRLVSDTGDMQSVQARYVIGCDGASSAVRRLTGIELDDLDFDEPWLVIDLQVNAQGLAKLPAVSAQYCEPSRPTTFIIGTGNHRRWEIMLLPGEDPHQMSQPEAVWRLLSRWLEPGDAHLWRCASYRFHALVARQWRSARVFVAGDAAHQQPPFLGQGMCQGLRDVTNLTWKLAQVLHGQAHDGLLDTYGLERAAHVRQLTSTIKHIGHTICERDPVIARQRDARLLEEAGGCVKTVPRQDLIPALHGGFLSSQQHAARGTLFPQPRVLHGTGMALLDDVAGGGWRVVLGEAANAWRPDLHGACTLIRFATPARAAEWQEAEGVMQAWFSRHDCLAAIVRPDHYVYAIARDLKELQAELDRLAQFHQDGSPPASAKIQPA